MSRQVHYVPQKYAITLIFFVQTVNKKYEPFYDTGKDYAFLVFAIQIISVSKTDLFYILYTFQECITHYKASTV